MRKKYIIRTIQGLTDKPVHILHAFIYFYFNSELRQFIFGEYFLLCLCWDPYRRGALPRRSWFNSRRVNWTMLTMEAVSRAWKLFKYHKKCGLWLIKGWPCPKNPRKNASVQTRICQFAAILWKTGRLWHLCTFSGVLKIFTIDLVGY